MIVAYDLSQIRYYQVFSIFLEISQYKFSCKAKKMSLFPVNSAPIESKAQDIGDFQERNCSCTIPSLHSILLYLILYSYIHKGENFLVWSTMFNFYFYVYTDDKMRIMHHILLIMETVSHFIISFQMNFLLACEVRIQHSKFLTYLFLFL